MRLVVAAWQKANVELEDPVVPDRLIELLSAFQGSVSEDVYQLYQCTGGMVDGEMDENYWSLWTPERIVQEGLTPEGYIVFADYLIDSHLHVLRCETTEKSSVHAWFGSGHYVRIADDLDSFFSLYRSNPLGAMFGQRKS
ncbi:MAG: hypothetical protein AAGJ10_06085 [Bacteroidota bacterium]